MGTPRRPKEAHTWQNQLEVTPKHIQRIEWLLVFSLAMHVSPSPMIPVQIQCWTLARSLRFWKTTTTKKCCCECDHGTVEWEDRWHSPHNHKYCLMLARAVGHQAKEMQRDCHWEFCFSSHCSVCGFSQRFPAKYLWTVLPGRDGSPPFLRSRLRLRWTSAIACLTHFFTTSSFLTSSHYQILTAPTASSSLLSPPDLTQACLQP